ncbi:MAG TPA: hypothetical protein VFE13_15165 [Caulobacteraceae bacterium]|jgi:hypothetical protein|nr:hypothetical protein [Caulobacteraceae bacterium]
MRISLNHSLVGLATAAALAAAPAAWAGCGPAQGVQPASWTPTGSPAGLLTPVALPAAAPSIVGMWSINFRAGGATIDFGYAQWHSDGTEIMNSGGRAPSTQNFCLGVWQQTGPLTYQLNHLALSYDATTGKLNAKVNIRETVTLSNANFYSGPFTIDVRDPKTGAVLQHVAGNVFGRRVLIDSVP